MGINLNRLSSMAIHRNSQLALDAAIRVLIIKIIDDIDKNGLYR
jgi:hypothetical protein